MKSIRGISQHLVTLIPMGHGIRGRIDTHWEIEQSPTGQLPGPRKLPSWNWCDFWMGIDSRYNRYPSWRITCFDRTRFRLFTASPLRCCGQHLGKNYKYEISILYNTFSIVWYPTYLSEWLVVQCRNVAKSEEQEWVWNRQNICE